MRARAFNPQVFLEFLCHGFFGTFMLHLVSSGQYLSYVAPRMEPYLYFTAAVMLIWACVSLFRLFRPQYKVRSAHCFVLTIPMLLLLLPHSPLSTVEFSSNYIGGGPFSDQTVPYATLPEQVSPDSVGSDMESGVQSDVQEATDLSGLDAASKKIIVSNDDFGMWFSELYINMDKYEGYTVVMTGFVFKDPEMLKEDEFVPARLMMSCCVADLAPAGLLCKYDKVSELKNNSWVTVEGTLFIGEYEYDGRKYKDPQIKVTKIGDAEAVEGYVYPY